jgi:hypothetical protein
MEQGSAGPYRASTPRGKDAKRRFSPDADVLVALLVPAPLFLAVVVRTAVRGETFGAGATLCAAFVVIAAWAAVSRLTS